MKTGAIDDMPGGEHGTASTDLDRARALYKGGHFGRVIGCIRTRASVVPMFGIPPCSLSVEGEQTHQRSVDRIVVDSKLTGGAAANLWVRTTSSVVSTVDIGSEEAAQREISISEAIWRMGIPERAA